MKREGFRPSVFGAKTDRPGGLLDAWADQAEGHDAGCQEASHQLQHAPVVHPGCHAALEPVELDRVEEFGKVHIDDMATAVL